MDGGLSLAMILMAASTAVSAVGTIQQGKEQKRQADFAAQQQEIDAQEQIYQGNAAATNARQSEADAYVQWGDAQRQRDRVMGTARTAAAKSGLTLSGSVLDAQNDTALNFQREATAQLNSSLNQSGNYRSESRGLFLSSRNSLASAANSRLSGKAARTNSYWAAGGTLLQGLGSAASMKAGSAKVSPVAGRGPIGRGD